MQRGERKRGVLVVGLLLSTGALARADVRLPAIFGDHMVLQQQADVAFWGWAEPGEKVTITPSWAKQPVSEKADAAGKWLARVRTPAAGGPFTIEVEGKNKRVLNDVLVGEVWICSGQSNMEWAFAYGGVQNMEQERAAANFPKIRLFDVPNVVSPTPKEDCQAAWALCTPDSVNGFSCVGYFFARQIQQELGVPVGLIGANWGGTVAEAWVSKEGLAKFPAFNDQLAWVAQEAADPGAAATRIADAAKKWWGQIEAAETGQQQGWFKKEFDDSAWKPMAQPGSWAGPLAAFDGFVWIRRAIDLPAELAGKELELTFGPIDDMDTTWFDGTKVGATESPGFHDQPRSYRVPANLATAGKHVVAVRVLDTGGPGGIEGSSEEMALRVAGGASLPLAGEWKHAVSIDVSKLPRPPQVRQLHANVATVLYNGLIAPIVPFGIRGALWYQGESNRGRAKEYRDLMPALIADWRGRFGAGDFPFFFVQIAPFNYDGTRSATAQLRQAQLDTLRVKNTGMVVTMDIGDPGNIHPANKQEVGRRLALCALAQTYGKPGIEASGPLFESMQTEGSSVRVRFTHTTGGLVAKGGPLTDFEVCGADGKWVAASATVDGDTLLVHSDAVAEPKEVRFGFGDACAPNLFNGTGLPASPFCKIVE